MATGLDVSGGLVEVAALTSLIGATTAESLILGSRGAAGLPWAAMSAFGSVFLIKACFAACTPGWLRDTFGVRNQRCDNAVGLSYAFDRTMKSGMTVGDLAGIAVHLRKRGANAMSKNTSKRTEQRGYRPRSIHHVHAFDGYTSGVLRTCPSTEAGQPPRIVHYARSGQWPTTRRQRAMIDWLSIMCSMLKLTEGLVLYSLGAYRLAVVTIANWAFFLLSALLLQCLGIGREYTNYFDPGPRVHLGGDKVPSSHRIWGANCVDVLAGDLPTVQTPAQHRKIILGVPSNPRHHIAWRFVWALGGVICVGSLVTTYSYLTQQSRKAVYVWLAFQILWVVSRSVFFHFAPETDSVRYAVTRRIPEWELRMYGFRILCIVVGISEYQALVHPRGPYCYTEDSHDPQQIEDIMQRWTQRRPDLSSRLVQAASTNSAFGMRTVDVEIKAVIGDTFLSSLAWVVGSPLTSMDLYDACLVVLQLDGETIIIPSARVLSGHVKELRSPTTNPEDGAAGEFVEKGGPNDAVDIGWVFWIPIGSDTWLYFVGDLNFLGTQRMEIVSSAEISRRLGTGNLFVSLAGVKDVQDVVEKSDVVGRLLADLLEKEDDGDAPPAYRSVASQ